MWALHCSHVLEVFNACESACVGLFGLVCRRKIQSSKRQWCKRKKRKKFKAPSNNGVRGKREKFKAPRDNGVRGKREKFKAPSDNGVRGKRKKNLKLQATMVQEGKENCVMRVFMRMEGFKLYEK